MRIWFFLLFFIGSGYAADTPEDIAKKAYQANINALMVFTSQEGLNTGHYRFTDAGFKMDIYHLPFIYHLDAYENNLNLFLIGNVGYSRTTLDDPIEVETSQKETEELEYDTKLRTYTGGLGVGVRYKTAYDIDILAGIEVIYSRTQTDEPTKDDVEETVDDVFNGNYNDNLTYKLLAQLEYHKEYKGYKPYAKLSYKLFETKADFDYDNLTSFSTQSSVTSLGGGVETPKLYAYNGMYLTLEGYLFGHYLGGDITDVAGFDAYSTVGAVAYWYTENSPDWAERFFLEVSTVNSSGLEGYNVGIGFTIDF